MPTICMPNSSWLPVNPEYKYHFVLNDSINQHLNPHLQFAGTIRVLSSFQANGAEVCQLNTIFDKTTLLYRQPQFLQREMVIRENGDVHFHNPESILIKTKTTNGQSWMLDTLAEVTATQIAVVQEALYGQPDSVRIFLLSSGDTMRLAKVYGLIQFPFQYGSGIYYQQAGVSGLERGFVPPDFFDCYDFEPGDRFEYRKSVSHAYGGTNTISQFSVIRRDDSYEGGIRYEVEGYSRVNNIDHGNSRITYHQFDELIQEESEYNHLNYFNREGIIEPRFSTVSAVKTGFFMELPHIITKGIQIHDTQPRLCDLPTDPNALCCDNCEYPPAEQRQYLHGKGLGLIYKSIYDDEYTLEEELVAVRKKDFSFGEFSRIGGLAEDDEAPVNSWSFPNPARNDVWIIMAPYDPNSTLVLLDSKGQVLMERSFLNDAQIHIDLTNYAPGMYFYFIRDEAGKATGHGKIVKSGFE